MKKVKKIILILVFMSGISLMLNNIYAASASITTNSDLETGTVTITATVTAAQWDLHLKVNGQTIADSSELENYEQNITRTITGTYNANTPGTLNISLDGDISDVNPENEKNKIIRETKTINVIEKKQEAPAQAAEQTNTSEPEKPTELEEPTEPEKPAEPEKNSNEEKNNEPEVRITDTSKTMYSTDSINVRSSYSTSSNAIGSLKQDDEVIVTGIASNGWTRIKYNGQTAYVSSQFLTDTKPKEKSKNNDLKSLKVSEGTLSPEFNKDVTSYKISVGKDVEKITVNAEVEDEKAKVEISGNEELKEGANNVKVIVTAESGDTKTYTISATREAKGKLQLASLDINGIKLNETFKPDKYEYTVTLANNSNTKKLDIKAKANDESATVEILGNENFVDGENVITIMVKSKDGKENVTYQIIVNKKAASSNTNTTTVSNNNKNNKNNDLFLYVAAGIFATALILIIIIIVRSIKKSKEDSDEDYDNEDELGIKNNYTEELYSTRNENDKAIDENKELSINKDNDNKLYDVEKEVDFSDKNVDEYDDMPKKKKGGKHSK